VIAALITVIAAPLLAFASWVAQPVTATCPRGWYLATGVRVRTGAFSCHLRMPIPQWPGIDAPNGPTLPGRVWCEGIGSARQNGVRVFCAGRGGRS
jgi:hypothetical protein